MNQTETAQQKVVGSSSQTHGVGQYNMSSQIYADINSRMLDNRSISYIAKLLMDSDEETDAGKSIIMLIYIRNNFGKLKDEDLVKQCVRGILDHGHGWKLKGFFESMAQKSAPMNKKEFGDYCNARAATCYVKDLAQQDTSAPTGTD